MWREIIQKTRTSCTHRMFAPLVQVQFYVYSLKALLRGIMVPEIALGPNPKTSRQKSNSYRFEPLLPLNQWTRRVGVPRAASGSQTGASA
jgi:hypothetical protein